MNLLVFGFCLAVVAVGALATTWLGVPLRAEERLAFGTVVGAVLVSTIAFPLTWLGGFDEVTVLGAVALAGLVAYAGWRRSSVDLLAEWRDLGARLRLPVRHWRSARPMAVLALASGAVSVRILTLAYGVGDQPGTVTVGHLSTFGDWSAHLAYTGSFVYADNFPPELPTAAGLPFTYHFGVDYFAALFVPLGSTPQAGLQISSGLLALAFPVVMYSATVRLVRSRAAGVLATLLFTMAGGTMGAVEHFWADDLYDSNLFDLPRTYAFDGFDKVFLDNPVLGFLFPQRPTLVGFPLALMLVALLLPLAPRVRIHDDPPPDRVGLVAIGTLIGFLPFWHVFAFPVLVGLALWWALLDAFRRTDWLYLLVPAIGLGVPLGLYHLPEESVAEWHLGWMIGKAEAWTSLSDLPWFWVYNTGVFLPLLAAAFFWRRTMAGPVALALAPIWALFVIPQIRIWHGWPGNNAKYVVFLLLLGAPFVAKLLVEIAKETAAGLAVVAVVVLLSVSSGGLDLLSVSTGTHTAAGNYGTYPLVYQSTADTLLGRWAREETAPDAVFVSAPDNAHAIRTAGFRRVVSGSSGRLLDLGVQWADRARDVTTVLSLAPEAADVINRYGVDYVVVGPAELALVPEANERWAAIAPIVYNAGGYAVYDAAAGGDPGVPRDDG